MIDKGIADAVEGFGLTIEPVVIPGHDDAFRVYKGAKQIFIGTEEAVRTFIGSYETERPGLLEGSMYGYRE